MPKVGEPNPNTNRITPQQQRFLDNYFHKDMSQTAAAREAGYAHPHVAATRVLNQPRIQERLSEMREEARARFGVTLDKSIRDLKAIRDAALQEGKYSAALKAEELRLKATGLLVNKSHVTHENIENMDKNQILAKLKEVMEKAQNRMIDVTPETSSQILDNVNQIPAQRDGE